MTSDISIESILDALDSPCLLVDSSRTIMHGNDAACDLLGGSLSGRSFVSVLRIPSALECLDSVISGEDSSVCEIRLDIESPVLYRLRIVVLGESPKRFLVYLSDVSSLVAADRMRSDFVSNVSHELRSPLTTISGLLQTLRGGADSDAEKRDHFFGIMQTEANRMERLISDLLALSRVESSSRVRPTKNVDLRDLVFSVVDRLGESGSISQRIELPDDSVPVMVIGDSDQIIQVIENVLGNSVKYSSPSGLIRITLETTSGGERILRIKDEGAGIPSEHIPRLTERFYRVDSSRSRSVDGTGLGLAITKHIMRRHRGRLTIRSSSGDGVEVSLFFPAEVSD